MRLTIAFCAFLGVLLSACASPPGGQGAGQRPPGVKELRDRGLPLWTARVAEDWKTTFEYLEPRKRAETTLEKYTDWKQTEEPLKYHSFQFGSVEAEPPMGWIEVDCSVSMRKYPKVPARDVHRWERWRLAGGQWFPVDPRELEHYPEAPSRRDAAEEARLQARFEASWQARYDEDWHRLHGFVDPRDIELVTEEQVTKSETLHKRLSYDLKWIEVIGSRGRVRAVYTVKLIDPNMDRVAPTKSHVTELWVNYQGDWYLDFGDGTTKRSSP